ncbi:MAG: NHLP leader peptide family RiPP precursor [Candidatus Obscuribacterales bacterium]|nr:NHLP leader peptide family RiPP precursor [Candidatus Obscuribacterales bacterium]
MSGTEMNGVGISKEEWSLYQKVIGKAWANDSFKKRLKDNPKAVLAEEGIKLPAGSNVVVMEDTKDKLHVVIPQHPAGGEGEVSLEDLAHAYGGNCCSCVLL